MEVKKMVIPVGNQHVVWRALPLHMGFELVLFFLGRDWAVRT